MQAIATLPNLRRLDVSDNNFKGKAGDVLIQALKNKVRYHKGVVLNFIVQTLFRYTFAPAFPI